MFYWPPYQPVRFIVVLVIICSSEEAFGIPYSMQAYCQWYAMKGIM
ncbi:MAG TPA: hypothetical protein VD884_10805 [Ohtaekwangia sp.]|nr:hypothetical protein [Ohtaekwangia sp.]